MHMSGTRGLWKLHFVYFPKALLLLLREEKNTNSNALFVYNVVRSVKEIGVQSQWGETANYGQRFANRAWKST